MFGLDAEVMRGDRDHFGVQALAHFGAAVVDGDGTVGVDENERAGLIEHRVGERDTEFNRHKADTAFDVAALGVEGRSPWRVSRHAPTARWRGYPCWIRRVFFILYPILPGTDRIER